MHITFNFTGDNDVHINDAINEHSAIHRITLKNSVTQISQTVSRVIVYCVITFIFMRDNVQLYARKIKCDNNDVMYIDNYKRTALHRNT